MVSIKLDVIGIEKIQAKELIEDLNSISGVDCNYITKESPIEVKEILTSLILDIGKGIGVSLIVTFILKFLKKEESRDNQPIIIENSNIRIIQGDSKEQIENKINIILNSQKNQ